MLPCIYREISWTWCKGIIFAIFATIAISYFAYGIIYAWQNTEDRAEIRRNQESFAKKAVEKFSWDKVARIEERFLKDYFLKTNKETAV